MANHVGEQQRIYIRDESVVFLKTHEEFGELSNMVSGFPITVNSIRIRTSEALYQACRFPHMPEVQRLILGQLSPMSAKMKSKPYRRTHSRPDWDNVNIKIMRWCLSVKLAQNWERFSNILLSTGSKPIVEESKRDPFWGAQPVDENTLVGKNILGRLLMELRERVRSEDMNTLCIVEPPPIPQFLLDGRPIGVINGLEPHAHVPGVPHKQQESRYSAMPLPFDVATYVSEQTPSVAAVSVRLASEPLPIGVQSMLTHAYRKKLIEVALPLDAINAESAREKSIRHGHPSTLHLWWARRPLAACRAVLFASLVDDPGNDLPEEEAKRERERLFRLIEQLVKWENSNNEAVLSAAREEIRKSTGGNPPPVLDPFAGGGSIPLEAQRLGLEAHASDLNPVAVLINKALIELPARFRDHRPVNPDAQQGMKAEAAPKSALAEDVRWYGKWMRDQAQKRIGHLYPKGPNGETVIAWLWARTVKCPNPACGAQMPLVRSFALSTKAGKEAWVEPMVDHAARTVRFEVRQGPGALEGTRQRGASKCLFCGNLASDDDVRQQAIKYGLGNVPLAMVCEGRGGRDYYPFPEDMVPRDVPEADVSALQASMPDNPRWFSPPMYGMTTYADLFTPRQLVALTTFSDLVGEARERVILDSGGDVAYADAVATYLAFGLSKALDRNNSLCSWEPAMGRMGHTLARHAIPMVWDFTETNPFAGAGGDLYGTVQSLCEVLDNLGKGQVGIVSQLDAAASLDEVLKPLISTDPPYYDNIGYADLSDFFYIWLRRTLSKLYPNLFSTLLTPKAQELVATPYRFEGSKSKAQRFFEEGLGKALAHIRAAENPAYPTTIYYAYKQAEGNGSDGATASTGWETMLQGLMDTGFSITGTWPMRSELSNRMIASGTNALASSIVLVCRPRPEDAPLATRKEFVRALQTELPHALDLLIKGTTGVSAIAPVDLAQAAIGPGMGVFSRYSQVLEASGEAMRVRTALELINQEIDRYFSEQEGEQDGPTRFCLMWYRSYGMGQNDYGIAETLSKATNVDVAALARQGLLTSAAGKVRLKPASEYADEAWDPATAHPLTTWEATHRLVRALGGHGGAGTAARIVRRLGGKAEDARALAYLLYTEADKRGWTAEALGYNTLVVEWPAINKAAAELAGPEQGTLL